MKSRILVALLVLMYIYGCGGQIALAQTVPASELRLTPRTAPSPLTGRYRFYVDPADGIFKCVTPSGASCMSSTSSITIGATTTGAAGTSASVSNSGTPTAPILNFTIPVGATGATGPTGQGFTFGGAWAPTTVYNAFDIVTNGGNTYEADHTFTSGATFSATNWNLWASAGGGGGSGTVTTFTTTSWPSWLTPTVTNATTTPNLDVSGGIVPEANGGTGANNTTGAAGHVLRSNGTHYVDSAIQVADVPTLNQSTTSIATGNFMALVFGPMAGTISTIASTTIAKTVLPANVTIRSFTMYAGTAISACTTNPTYQLWDFTGAAALSTITSVNGTTYYTNTGLSAAATSGHDIGIRVGVGGAGCTAEANATWTIWYTM